MVQCANRDLNRVLPAIELLCNRLAVLEDRSLKISCAQTVSRLCRIALTDLESSTRVIIMWFLLLEICDIIENNFSAVRNY